MDKGHPILFASFVCFAPVSAEPPTIYFAIAVLLVGMSLPGAGVMTALNGGSGGFRPVCGLGDAKQFAGRYGFRLPVFARRKLDGWAVKAWGVGAEPATIHWGDFAQDGSAEGRYGPDMAVLGPAGIGGVGRRLRTSWAEFHGAVRIWAEQSA